MSGNAPPKDDYSRTLSDVIALLEEGRRAAARSVNALMTATYWLVGWRIVESEQGGLERAAYGQAVLQRLSINLAGRLGRGFGTDNLELMRLFYLSYQPGGISEPAIRKSRSRVSQPKAESLIREFRLQELAERFPLSWTHYVRLLRRTRSPEGAGVLRNGSLAWRLECTAARAADWQPVLYAYPDVQKQAGDA